MNNENQEMNITRYISRLHKEGKCFVNKEVSKYGIKSGQVFFLIDLYKKEGRSQEEIAESLHIDKATTARALSRLEEEGFVKREKDKKDKRFNSIYLTEKSKGLKSDIYGVIEQWHKKMGDCLTKDEEVLLKKLLEKVCDNIN